MVRCADATRAIAAGCTMSSDARDDQPNAMIIPILVAITLVFVGISMLRPRLARADVLKEGDVAPPINTQMVTGAQITPFSLTDYRARKIVLYFYPKDDTPGCTKEACAFRDGFAKFQSAGLTVLGCSVDSKGGRDQWSRLSARAQPCSAHRHGGGNDGCP